LIVAPQKSLFRIVRWRDNENQAKRCSNLQRMLFGSISATFELLGLCI